MDFSRYDPGAVGDGAALNNLIREKGRKTMTTTNAAPRLPWFPCDPEKLLGALASMGPNQGYLYVVVLLRIYETGGRCFDSLDALCNRTKLNRRVVSDALNQLFKAGKLYRDGDGIMNPVAARILSAQKARRGRAEASGREGSRQRWEKDKENQLNFDGVAIATPCTTDGYIEKEREKEEDSLSPVGERGRQRHRRNERLAPDWQPSADDVAFAKRAHMSDAEIALEADRFRDHWTAKGEARASWPATWRNWVRKSIEFGARDRNRANGGGNNGNRNRGLAAAADDLIAFGEARERQAHAAASDNVLELRPGRQATGRTVP